MDATDSANGSSLPVTVGTTTPTEPTETNPTDSSSGVTADVVVDTADQPSVTAVMTTGPEETVASQPIVAETVEDSTEIGVEPIFEGDTDRVMNKKVRLLISTDAPKYNIFIDEEYQLQWYYGTNFTPPATFAQVSTKVGEIDAYPVELLSTDQIVAFRKLLGHGVQAGLRGMPLAESYAYLKSAETFVHARLTDKQRVLFLIAGMKMGFATLGICVLILLVTYNWWQSSTPSVFSATGLEVIRLAAMCAAMGAVGAFFSIAARVSNIPLEPRAGRQAHEFEGAVRIVVGTIAAIIAMLGVLAKILFNFDLTKDEGFYSLLILCCAAGSSESLVSGLLARVGATGGQTPPTPVMSSDPHAGTQPAK
jgi:hypothetical protein